MKLVRIGLLVASVLPMSTPATAQQDCQMEIREGSAARDLGRVLKCFDERIKALEAKGGAGEARQGSGPQANTASEFDAGSFAVSVRAATRSSNRQRVTILVNFRNKTTEEIYIAESHKGDDLMLFDEQSGESSRGAASGLKKVYSNYTKEYFTAIPPSATVSASLQFDGRKIIGSTGNLTLNLLQYSTPQHKPVPISLVVRIRD